MSNAFNHDWFGEWMGDEHTAKILSAEADLARMRLVEIAWINAQVSAGTVAPELAKHATDHITNSEIHAADLRAGVARDGIPVPEFVKRLKENAGNDVQPIIHTGLTSQDVLDTSFCMALGEIVALFKERLKALTKAMTDLESKHGENTLMGYTRMQAALPISAKTRIASWRRPLDSHLVVLEGLETEIGVIQFGGPVGERGTYGENGTAEAFAGHLGLRDPGFAWHTDRTRIVAVGAAFSHIAGSLGKFGQDVTLMAQRGPDDIVLRGGGSSSAMPHKQNPILGELLVALAHRTAALQANLTNALVHEQERSGAMWTLEMMAFPDLAQSSGRALTAAVELAEKIENIGH